MVHENPHSGNGPHGYVYSPLIDAWRPEDIDGDTAPPDPRNDESAQLCFAFRRQSYPYRRAAL